MVKATVQRYTLVDDGMGGKDYQWMNHLVDIVGILDQLSADEILASEKLSQKSSHVFILFEILDITENDRMIINNKKYNIKNVDDPMHMHRQMEILLEYAGDADGS